MKPAFIYPVVLPNPFRPEATVLKILRVIAVDNFGYEDPTIENSVLSHVSAKG